MTPLWTADDLRAASGGVLSEPFRATGVSIDTRTLTPGDLFVALVGENGDGHDHVAAAMAQGAAGALVHRECPGLPTLRVDNTLSGLTALGRFARARFAGRLVAVTGSVGKTTTKEMLRAIMSACGPTHTAHASYNNHWGVPLTLALLPPDAAFCVVEIGMNHAGEIAPLARLARPHVALVTAIEAVHIGHLGSIEAIAQEKAAIAQGLEPGGVTVLPLSALPLLHGIPAPRITFGAQGDARLLFVEQQPDAITVTASIQGHTLRFSVAAAGLHMAMNAVASLAVAASLDLDLVEAALALGDFSPVAGRGLRRAILGGAAVLIDESYNASPASVRAALSVLARQDGRRVAVLGDMLELGDASEDAHADLAADVAANADLLFACGPHMRALFDAVPAPLRGAHAADAETLASTVADAVAAGDAVLVKGSRGSAMRHVVAALERR